MLAGPGGESERTLGHPEADLCSLLPTHCHLLLFCPLSKACSQLNSVLPGLLVAGGGALRTLHLGCCRAASKGRLSSDPRNCRKTNDAGMIWKPTVPAPSATHALAPSFGVEGQPLSLCPYG